MKKVLMIAAIFAGLYTVEGMNTAERFSTTENVGTIATRDIFENGAARFTQVLSAQMNAVSQGNTSPDTALQVVSSDCCNWFGSIREQLNTRYNQSVAERENQVKERARRIIARHKAEIQNLRNQLSSLTTSNAELRNRAADFETQLRDAESKVEVLENQLLSMTTPELVNDGQSWVMSETLAQELSCLTSEIQNGQRTQREAFMLAEGAFRVDMRMVNNSLSVRYAALIEASEREWEDRTAAMLEAHRQQRNAFQDLVNELTRQKNELDRRIQRKTKVSRVFLSNPSLRPEKIRIRASNVQTIDVFGRHRAAEEEYNKFRLFSELIGDRSLGITTATQQDLENVRNYIQQTVVNATMPTRAEQIPGFRYIGGDCVWGEANVDLNEYNRIAGIFPEMRQNYGPVYDNYHRKSFGGGWPGNHRWSNWNGKDSFIRDANTKIAARNAANEALYNSQLSHYNSEVARANAVVFPTASFNRLIDQFNDFVSEL